MQVRGSRHAREVVADYRRMVTFVMTITGLTHAGQLTAR